MVYVRCEVRGVCYFFAAPPPAAAAAFFALRGRERTAVSNWFQTSPISARLLVLPAQSERGRLHTRQASCTAHNESASQPPGISPTSRPALAAIQSVRTHFFWRMISALASCLAFKLEPDSFGPLAFAAANEPDKHHPVSDVPRRGAPCKGLSDLPFFWARSRSCSRWFLRVGEEGRGG